jgi:hypothetical protein
MTYACPTWEYMADGHLLKLQCVQNRILHAIGNFEEYTLVFEMLVAFKIPYVYDYVTKLFRMQVEVMLNYYQSVVHGTGQVEAKHRKEV